jgi:hypothetical protein
MTVSNTTVRAGPFTPNGVTTAFPFAFKAFSASEIRVYRVVDGEEETIASGFDVDVDAEGGTVTFSVAPATDSGLIYIESDVDFTQNVDLENQGGFYPDVIDQGFDRAAARDLILLDLITNFDADQGDPGDDGWAPILAAVADGARIVHQVVDWTGGDGTKPTTGLYVGAAGLVAAVGDAVNIRGASGAGSGDLVASQNLNDVADKPTALANLGADTKYLAKADNLAALTDKAVARTSLELDTYYLKQGLHTIPILAAAMTARTTSGAAAGTTESATNKVMLRTLDFDSTADEFAQIVIPMPKSWNEGTITAQFVWTADAGSGGQTVRWAIQGFAYSDDDAVDQAFGAAVTVDDTLIATGDVHISAATAAITIGGTPAQNDVVSLQVYRDVSEDNLNADARLIAVRLFYTLNAGNDA